MDAVVTLHAKGVVLAHLNGVIAVAQIAAIDRVHHLLIAAVATWIDL